jgi:hypothetical protein
MYIHLACGYLDKPPSRETDRLFVFEQKVEDFLEKGGTQQLK